MTQRMRRATIIEASALYFALVFGAGFILGSIRIPLLVPRFGVRIAELLEVPVMLTVIWFAARHIVRRFALVAGAAAAAGLLALVLFVIAELTLATLISGRPISEYISNRDPVSGSAYLASILVYAALPWMLASGRN
jgi:hypothetical protein